MFYKKGLLWIGAVFLCLGLSSCAYQMQIQQGVDLKPSQISQLKPGLTHDQVEYILGTPNLVDSYHPNTWYYIYTNKENRQPFQSQKLIVNFNEAGQVVSFQQTGS